MFSQNIEAQKVKRGSKMKYRWKRESTHRAQGKFESKNNCISYTESFLNTVSANRATSLKRNTSGVS